MYSGQERVSRGEFRGRQDRSTVASPDKPKTGVRWVYRHIRALAFTGVIAVIAVPAQAQTEPGAQATGLLPAIARSTAAELSGTLVENRRGAVIGSIGGIVRAPDGELIGIVRPSDLGPGVLRGESFPLSDFGRRGDRLTAPTDKDAAMLDDTQVWEEEIYQTIAPDIALGRLAESSALRADLEDINAIRPFSDLDQDHDGVLSPSEAHASPRIGSDWVDLDANADGVIDSSEFRALSEEAVAPTAEETNR